MNEKADAHPFVPALNGPFSGQIYNSPGTGTFNPGSDPITISKGAFNEKTRAIHLEAEGRGRGGARNHCVIDGKLDKGTITGTWKYEKGNGDFRISMQ